MYVYVCMYVCMYIYMCVFLIFNAHWPILIQRSGRAEGYAATLCAVPLDLTCRSQYATVSTVYSRCVYIFLGYLKRRIYRKLSSRGRLESVDIFSRFLHEILRCAQYVVLKMELPSLR